MIPEAEISRHGSLGASLYTCYTASARAYCHVFAPVVLVRSTLAACLGGEVVLGF